MGTGETVAVKQIKLADLPKSELRVITVRTSGPSIDSGRLAKNDPLARDRPVEKPRCTLSL